jgi:hypothetical protein
VDITVSVPAAVLVPFHVPATAAAVNAAGPVASSVVSAALSPPAQAANRSVQSKGKRIVEFTPGRGDRRLRKDVATDPDRMQSGTGSGKP